MSDTPGPARKVLTDCVNGFHGTYCQKVAFRSEWNREVVAICNCRCHCKRCGGTGEITVPIDEHGMQDSAPCPDCAAESRPSADAPPHCLHCKRPIKESPRSDSYGWLHGDDSLYCDRTNGHVATCCENDIGGNPHVCVRRKPYSEALAGSSLEQIKESIGAEGAAVQPPAPSDGLPIWYHTVLGFIGSVQGTRSNTELMNAVVDMYNAAKRDESGEDFRGTLAENEVYCVELVDRAERAEERDAAQAAEITRLREALADQADAWRVMAIKVTPPDAVDWREVAKFYALKKAESIDEALAGGIAPPSARPKVVCLCGSTRFTEEMLGISWDFAKRGVIALAWNVLPNSYGIESHGAEAEGIKEQIDELHKRKIDMCDEVLVLNIGGYIGESTRSERDYALTIGKPVKYLEPIAAPPSPPPTEPAA